MMQYTNLTDRELLHYAELDTTDPVVQRLCQIQFEEMHELRNQIDELTEQVEDLESDLENAIDDRRSLARENRILREKIQVWKAMEE